MRYYYEFDVRWFRAPNRSQLVMRGFCPFSHRQSVDITLLELYGSEEGLDGGRLAHFAPYVCEHQVGFTQAHKFLALDPYIEWLAEHAHEPWSVHYEINATLSPSGHPIALYAPRPFVISFANPATAVFFKLVHC